jgi:cytochrome P450
VSDPAVVVTSRRDVLEVLERPEFVPHRLDDPSRGPTIELRNVMARFSDGREHAARRASVEAAIASVDVHAVASAARARTQRDLARGELDVLAIAARVPVASLGEALGVRRSGQLDELVADVGSIVSVIGRGCPADADSDAATTRVLERFADRPEGAVAWVSVLYQAMDATAALISTRVLEAATGTPAVPAVPRTRRRATVAVEIGARRFDAGTELSVEFGAADLPFGAGPHSCPGRDLAVAIADAVVAEIDARRVDLAAVRSDADGRPTRLGLSAPCGS